MVVVRPRRTARKTFGRGTDADFAAKNFSFDVRDYDRVQQLRREQLAPREISVAVRFADLSEAAAKHRFFMAQARDEIVCVIFAAKFAEDVAGQEKLVRQLRLALAGLEPRPAQRTFWD
jgi:CO/xanthine dehydrogenase FAD-binding subunit